MERIYKWLLPLSLWIIAKGRMMERIPTGKLDLHHKMVALYGENKDLEHSLRFAAETVSASLLGLFAAVVLYAVSGGDTGLLLTGCLTAAVIPLAMYKELDRKIRRRKRFIVLELPELLNAITLLVNAGETVQGAIQRCAANRMHPAAHTPLKAELKLLAGRLHNGEPFPQAMEQFSKRCGVQEVAMFAAAVLMNYRRGGDSFVLALKALAGEMWERRKAMTRTLGEEASSKLIFPMLLVFLVVMTIVAAPAVMFMDQP